MKAGHTLAFAPLQIVQALAGLGAIALFTRLMDPAEFGLYALALSASMLAHTLLFTSVEACAFRFYSRAHAEGRLGDHFATLLALAGGLSALALAGGALFLTLLGAGKEIISLALFAGGAAILRCFTRIARESERAALDVGRYVLFETIYLTAGFAAGALLLWRFDWGPAAPFAGLLLAGAFVVMMDAPRWIGRAARGRVEAKRAAAYAAYGAPLALALAIDLAVQTAVRFILAHQAGTSAVGAYAAAFGLARPLDLIFIAAGAALSPLLLAAYEKGGAGAVRDTAGAGFTVMAACALPAAVGLALVATPLATFLVGETLSAEAARVLPWLALTGLATGLNLYYFSEAFQLARRTGLRALAMLAPGALQVALTFPLAAHFGAVGAAMAAAAGAGAGTLLLALIAQRLISLPLRFGELVRIALATAAMAAAVFVVRDESPSSLPIAIGAGIGAYGIVALMLNVAGARVLLSKALSRLRLLHFPEQTHAR